jgi:predicted transcriptional regulator
MNRGDKQTSLLHKMPYGGVMVFKDFTSMISKNEQSRMTIMGQLREIYDGAYTKRTGNGEDVLWSGKIGAIAGVTESIFQHMESMSAMGDRFVLYQVKQPDRVQVTKYKINQIITGVTEYSTMPILKEMTEQYLQRAFNAMASSENLKLNLSEKQINEIVSVADFCTMVRSGMIIDKFRGRITFVPTPEMPMRMFEQMYAIAVSFMFMRKLDESDGSDEIPKEDLDVIYKIAFDSIPVVRRIALQYLTLYDGGVTTAALARKINYESEVVAGWLAQLNSLGIVRRTKQSSGGNGWVLEEKYRTVMERLNHIKALGKTLDDEGEIASDDVDRHWNTNKSYESSFDSHDEFTSKEADENDEW